MQKLARLSCIGMAALALAAPPSSRADIYTLFYDNIPGNLVSDLIASSAFPNSPTRAEARPFFKPFIGENLGANYGFRMAGYFSPPDTANYNFYISAMDTAALYLSTDDNPTNKVLIASEPNPPGNQDHNFLGVVRRNPVAPENRSTTLFPGGIPLVAGKKYFIEALHKAGVETIACCDVMAVAVEGGSLPPVTNSIFVVDDNSIPGAYLSMAVNEGPGAILVQPADQTVVDGRRPTFTCRVDGTPPYELQLLQFGVFPVATATFHTPSGYASITGPPANLTEDDGAEYVIAVNGVLSDPAILHVTPDTDVPALVSVAGASSLDGILVTFSEPVHLASATDRFNYSITNQNGAPLGINFTAPITLLAGDRTVLLPTEAQIAGDRYCVVVNNVQEAASAAKTVAADSVACFEVPALSITRHPQTVGAPERGRAAFSVGAVATTPISYQWQQAPPGSDEFADVSGATSSSYVHSPVRPSDNGTRFRCRVSANGSDITSGVGAISVIYQDSQRPTVVVATAATGLAGVWVRYSEPVDPASATLPANYGIDGITISGASLDPTGTLVTLTTSPLTAGTPYVLHVSGVKDTAAAQNPILPDTQVSFTATATGYAATVLADEPVVYLQFEEDIGATAAQNLGSLGAPANATYQPGPTTVASPSGLVPPTYQGFTPANRAATFTGSERLTVSEVDVFAALGTNVLKGADGLTIEAWVNPNFASGRATLLTQQGGNGIGWLWVGPGNMQFASGGTGFGGNNGYPFPHTTWHHLAAVMDTTGHKIYFDGNQVHSGGNNPAGPASASDANVIIGGGGDVWSNGEEVALFKGQMDEVALYRKALSPADLKRHFDAAIGNVPLGPNEINLITLSQGHVVIDWNVGGILQSATNVAGPYADVPGAIAPPYANLLPTQPTFWRVRR
jgi:hypothetical protein